jgi:DNA-directed RNA polymerase subunit alpha
MTFSAQAPFFISCKECRIENPRNFYGCFYIGPFKPSQSLTVANALRRTLLSEFAGVAITSVYIEGATHEFQTLPGIRDSVLDIILNLKEIVLKSTAVMKKPLLGYLQVRGPGVVRACDLKLPAILKCIDPNQYIATLSHDGNLSLKFTICEGSNAKILTPKRIQQENLLYKALDDKIPICTDPVFTPIHKVNYMIESDQLYYNASTKINKTGQIVQTTNTLPNTSYNHVIVLELWTNGSIHPKEAVSQAFTNLICLFSSLGKMNLIQSSVTQSMLKSNRNVEKIIEKMAFIEK